MTTKDVAMTAQEKARFAEQAEILRQAINEFAALQSRFLEHYSRHMLHVAAIAIEDEIKTKGGLY